MPRLHTFLSSLIVSIILLLSFPYDNPLQVFHFALDDLFDAPVISLRGTSSMLRFGQKSEDEFFVGFGAASKGVVITNLSKYEPLVMLKHYPAPEAQ